MEKKTVKIEAFLDGLVSFWQLDEERRPVLRMDGIRYQNRIVGYKRNYTAEQAGHIVKKLIRIPHVNFAAGETFAVIDKQQYKVLQAQDITDTIPRCTDLTLEQPDILLAFDEAEAGAGGRC